MKTQELNSSRHPEDPVRRNHVPGWLRRVCLAKIDMSYRSMSTHANPVLQAVLADLGLRIFDLDHYGSQRLPDGRGIFVIDPYALCDPDSCDRWKRFKQAGDYLGLQSVWHGAEASTYPQSGTVRMFWVEPKNLKGHCKRLREERAGRDEGFHFND